VEVAPTFAGTRDGVTGEISNEVSLNNFLNILRLKETLCEAVFFMESGRLCVPECMRNLPVFEGRPVPWFQSWRDLKPELGAAMSQEKLRRALAGRLCIVCGQDHEPPAAFVGDVTLGIEQVARVPVVDVECAQWVARHAEFLPRLEEEGAGQARGPTAGEVRLVMICRGWGLRHINGQARFNLWKPERVEWYLAGRSARRAEVLSSLEACWGELKWRALTWAGGLAELRRRRARLEKWFPNN
jgi:hypothetical protein